MRSLTLLTLILTLGLTACGGGDDAADASAMTPEEAQKAAYDAFDAQNYADAVPLFDKALEGGDNLDLRVDSLKALAHVDGEKTLAEVEKLVDKLNAKQFRDISSELFSGNAHTESVHVMDRGFKKFPDDEKMVAFKDNLVKKIQEAGSSEGSSALDGLGYGGG